MLRKELWTAIAEQIGSTTGQPFGVKDRRSVGGGCINEGYRLQGGDRAYFVKVNEAIQVEMFSAEALGLQQIAATHTIRVPQPICWGSVLGHSYLVLEWLELGGGDRLSYESMGRKLAQLHRRGQGDRFGWDRQNTIGSTPQPNPWTESWADFFAQHRIGFQVKLANRRGGGFGEMGKIVEMVRSRLANHDTTPSLVHGDLWSGNAAVTLEGDPVILDPAVYYGDREVDLAMTELFGGFPAAFYQGYQGEWPLPPGYADRKSLYNLYHVLNHFNLFGGGYGDQARQMLQNLMV